MAQAIFLRSLCAAALAVLLAACGREEIEFQRVPKGLETLAEARPAPTGEAGAAPGRWTLPEGWSESPGGAPMRLATLSIPDADGAIEAALTTFPGDVGGELANVNRWRTQMGLEPLGEEALEAALERFSTPGHRGYLARIDAGDRTMLAVGVHGEAADRMWFLRLTASPAAADRLRGTVLEFAKSIGQEPAP